VEYYGFNEARVKYIFDGVSLLVSRFELERPKKDSK
jgi:hypothetical protein